MDKYIPKNYDKWLQTVFLHGIPFLKGLRITVYALYLIVIKPLDFPILLISALSG